MFTELIFLINLCATLFLTGLIWVIQVVHYPSFRFVSEKEFLAFHQFHSQRISYLVIPTMTIELITSGILWWLSTWFSLNSIGFYLVILIWISTALFSVPCHSKLLHGKDMNILNKLVSTNWIRTVLWSTKMLVSLWVLHNN